MKNRTFASVSTLLAFAVLAGGSMDEGKSSGGSSGGAAARTVGAPAMPMPASQQAFCDAVKNASQDYEAAKRQGANELKLSKIRTLRKTALAGALAGTSFKDWVGTISEMTTTGEGKAHVSIELPCGVSVGTWNNELSDIMDNSLIPQSSPLYDALADTGKGKSLKFGGKFLPDAQNGFKEMSLTEDGSMTNPAFVVRFTSVGR